MPWEFQENLGTVRLGYNAHPCRTEICSVIRELRYSRAYKFQRIGWILSNTIAVVTDYASKQSIIALCYVWCCFDEFKQVFSYLNWGRRKKFRKKCYTVTIQFQICALLNDILRYTRVNQTWCTNITALFVSLRYSRVRYSQANLV